MRARPTLRLGHDASDGKKEASSLTRKGKIMYVRTVSFVVTPFKVKGFCDCVDEIARDIASKQPGFVEHVVLISEREKRLVTVLSFWQTKAEADSYQDEVFPSALQRLNSMIDSGPVIQYYTASVSHCSTMRTKSAVAA
jgi:heme-degrading monooxygenase HmoA